MKLSIKAELVYAFAPKTQIVASIEASQTNDQTILSEKLDIQPPIQLLSDKTPYGDRSIRASLSGEVGNPLSGGGGKQFTSTAAIVRSPAFVVGPAKRRATILAT